MKTNLIKATTHALNIKRTETYNKVERIEGFNRTNYTEMKQFDFTQSVDYSLRMPQI